jgi:parallel beta-helix repeat protein
MMKPRILFALACLTSADVAHAATYFVSKTGNDSSSCAQAQSTSTPKLTIGGGLGCLAPGDTLLVRAGTYSESVLNSQSRTQVASGTSWSNKIRIAAYPGETVWMAPTGSQSVVWLILGSYIEFDGINIDGRNVLGTAFATGETAHHIRIQNAEIIRGTASGGGESDGVMFGAHYFVNAIGSNEAINLRIHGGYAALGYGIYLSGPNNLVDGCDIYDTSSAGVHIYNGGGDPADGNIVRNTRIHNLSSSGQDRGWGILVAGSNNQIYNNVIDHLTLTGPSNDAGIYVYYGSGNKLYSNTISHNAMSGIYIDSGASNTQVMNNIAHASSGSNFVNAGTGTTQSNNLFGVDPLFVDEHSGDFQLQVGSPAIDSGVIVVATDRAGVARPQGSGGDIGAYERPMSAVPAVRAPAAPRNLTVLAGN